MKRLLIVTLIIIFLVGVIGRALLYHQGLQVTSWWRSPWKNYEVGGNWLSLHLIGWAYDVVPVNKLMQEALKAWPFKVVVESDHIHLQIL